MTSLLDEVKNAHKVRAEIYYFLFLELRKEFGVKKAKQIMGTAIYKYGLKKSKSYGKDKINNIEKSAKKFCKRTKTKEKIFNTKLRKLTDDKAIIEINTCPLVERWKEMGLKKNIIKTLCEIANCVDYGTFEGLKLNLEMKSTLGEADDCCTLVLT
ncbi:hypothetical protein BVX93_01840 [bacterium B13(2017)]|nr:hypothetical protein BVX93_01840 [bacterium B13(2017)]